MKNSSEIIITNLIKEHPEIIGLENKIKAAIDILVKCYLRGNKLLVCGNGGSASDSLHIVGELMKSFVLPRKIDKDEIEKLFEISSNPEYLQKHLQKSLSAISLVSETALMTAYSNDAASDLVFAQQVYGYGNSGDVLLVISTSGNSKNILYACEVAKLKGLETIALTGNNGGKVKDVSDISIIVPLEETYKIQELHLPIYHVICLVLENEFFGDSL